MAAISFLCSLFVIIIWQASARMPSCDNSKGNYTINSTYDNNLNTLLSSFSSHTEINYGFYNFSYGQGIDKVYAIGVCRGDRKPDECLKCLNDSRVSLAQLCPNQKEAIVWGDNCTLRYSNRSIFGVMENQPTEEILYTLNVTGSVDQFSEALQSLMRNLTLIAASGDSRRKYATGSTPAPNFQTIYGYTQCTPDLTTEDCTKCLNEAISEIPDCCSGKAGGNILKPSCRIRFDLYYFYGPTLKLDPDAPPPPSPSTNNTFLQENYKGSSRTIIILIVVLVMVSAVLFFFWCYLRRRKTRKSNYRTLHRKNFGHESITLEGLQFDLITIKAATNNFSFENKIGKGGFGEVYKGILCDGRNVAVKRLSTNSKQGSIEFENEILLIANLQHRNLVTFIGFCSENQEKILIYEYMPNGSLDYLLFDTQRQKLSWSERYIIIKGTAMGILYLHEYSRLKVIHRDLKPSNVLLDENMNPKISDFGMARIVEIDQDIGNTNRIVGTHGYMSPEYAMVGQFSEKSDVFSFGVMVLEIITGKKSVKVYESRNVVEGLLGYVWRQWKDQEPLSILDTYIKESYSQMEVLKCIHIGLLCVQENLNDRPTMAVVISYLNNHSLELPFPQEPAFFLHRRRKDQEIVIQQKSSSSQAANTSTLFSINEISASNFYPR